MQNVEMNRDELLAILRENRERHKEIYEEAVKKYHAALNLKLQDHRDKLARHREGDASKPYDFKLNLPVPEEHLAEYDGAIRMVELDVRDEIHLLDFEFQQYVLDEWSWKGRFAANTTSYTG